MVFLIVKLFACYTGTVFFLLFASNVFKYMFQSYELLLVIITLFLSSFHSKLQFIVKVAIIVVI